MLVHRHCTGRSLPICEQFSCGFSSFASTWTSSGRCCTVPCVPSRTTSDDSLSLHRLCTFSHKQRIHMAWSCSVGSCDLQIDSCAWSPVRKFHMCIWTLFDEPRYDPANCCCSDTPSHNLGTYSGNCDPDARIVCALAYGCLPGILCRILGTGTWVRCVPSNVVLIAPHCRTLCRRLDTGSRRSDSDQFPASIVVPLVAPTMAVSRYLQNTNQKFNFNWKEKWSRAFCCRHSSSAAALSSRICN